MLSDAQLLHEVLPSCDSASFLGSSLSSPSNYKDPYTYTETNGTRERAHEVYPKHLIWGWDVRRQTSRTQMRS